MVGEQQEPLLAIDQIQGNVLPGFNKHFQAFLFLKIDDVQYFRRWLGTLHITTMEEVLAFVCLRKEEERYKKPFTKATWINIAFSHSALMQLGVLNEGDFTDQAFREGLWQRSESLGDPIGGREGGPRTWVVGGPKNEADVVLIIASDCLTDLYDEVTRIEDTIYAYVPPKMSEEMSAQSGVRIIFKQHGANLPKPFAGHEHFGFRDGISQPGVRGRIPKNLHPARDAYLTPREDPPVEGEGKSGQKLVWPGEFVFGYPKQDPKNSLEAVAGTDQEFTRNGSFLVFRRLRQDVGAFHRFLHDKAEQYEFTAEHFGAMCVGRRVSGASIFSNPGKAGEKSVQDDRTNNAFEFQKGESADPNGKVCPFAAHIRRTNPRDDLDKNEAQTHRLLRRGIPYGEPSTSTFAEPSDDTVDRGLLFIAYQTSIENQFEHMQKVANNPWFREGEPGYDPIIGQNNRDLPRTFRITSKDGRSELEVALPTPGWVIPTGGGYFFAPSIKVMKDMLAHTR